MSEAHITANTAIIPVRGLPVRRKGRAALLAMTVLAVLCVPLLGASYMNYVVMLALINVIAATGVNIGMGYCGLVSVGQAGFASIGAYGTALLMARVALPFPLAVAGGAGLAGMVGLAIGLPALRLSPLYIAMVTFGFGQAMNSLAVNWIALTGGPNGMAVPEPTLFDVPLSPFALYALVVVMTVASVWLARNVAVSRLGRALVAVRESETAAQSAGVKVGPYKMAAFGMGAVLGGLSGGLYALVSGYVNPDAFVFGLSISYVAMCVAGGLGTVAGPVIGAAMLTLLPEMLRSFAEYREVLSGVILLGFLVLMPQGIGPLTAKGAARLRRWLQARRDARA